MSDETNPKACNALKVARRARKPRLETILDERQVKRLTFFNKTNARLLSRVFRNQVGPRQAIKAQCLDCVGEDKAAVRECNVSTCPLWRFRPYQRKVVQA